MTRLTLASTRRIFAFSLSTACVLLVGCSSSRNSVASAPIDEPAPEFAKLSAVEKSAENDAYEADSFFDPFAIGVAQPIDQIAAARTPQHTPQVNAELVSVFGDLSNSQNKTEGQPSRRTAQYADQNVAQVSFSAEGADFDPDLSADGTLVVYASTQHTTASDIYIKSVESRTVTQLTSDPANDLMPVISPDGKRIAFASDRNGSWNIFVMNSTGGQAVQLTSDPTHELHPTWSPDGSKICYCRLGNVSGKWELWVANASNPAARRFIGYGLFPSWSPKNNTIVFQRSRQRGDRFFSAWTIDYTNGEGVHPTEIISSPVAAVVNPCFSPDGNRIAFTVIPNPDHKYGDRPNKADIWICNLDGSGRANLTGGRFVNLSPAWATNGRIHFVSDRSGKDNLWSLTPEQAILAGAPSTSPNSRNTGVANAPTE